jgi:hypothetical protein
LRRWGAQKKPEDNDMEQVTSLREGVSVDLAGVFRLDGRVALVTGASSGIGV